MIQATYRVFAEPKGFEQITVSTTAIGLTIPSGASRAVCRVESEPIRWRDDGTAPTATVGMLQKADDEFELVGSSSLKNFKAIRDGASDATLSVVYYG